MKAKIFLLVLVLISTVAFSQRQITSPTFNNVQVNNKVTVKNIEVKQSLVFDEVKVTTGGSVVGDTVAATINWKLGNIQKMIIKDTTLVTFISPGYPAELTLYMVHDTGTMVTHVEFVPTVKWVGGTNFTTTNTSGAIDKIKFDFDGTTYYGTFSKAYAP
jgi:hypothetical protein